MKFVEKSEDGMVGRELWNCFLYMFALNSFKAVHIDVGWTFFQSNWRCTDILHSFVFGQQTFYKTSMPLSLTANKTPGNYCADISYCIKLAGLSISVAELDGRRAVGCFQWRII